MPGAERLHDLSVRLDGRDVTRGRAQQRAAPVLPDRAAVAGRPYRQRHGAHLRPAAATALQELALQRRHGRPDDHPARRSPRIGRHGEPSAARRHDRTRRRGGGLARRAPGQGAAPGRAAPSRSLCRWPTAPRGSRSRPPTAPATPPRCTARCVVDATPAELTLTGIEKVETDDTPRADVIATDAAGTPVVKMTSRRPSDPHARRPRVRSRSRSTSSPRACTRWSSRPPTAAAT